MPPRQCKRETKLKTLLPWISLMEAFEGTIGKEEKGKPSEMLTFLFTSPT